MLTHILEDELISAFGSRLALIRPPLGRIGVQNVPDGLFAALKTHLPQAERIESIQAAASACFDLLVAPFVLPWHPEPRTLLAEWRRILRPAGILMLTALGPDTLIELPHTVRQPTLIDMHDLGDILVATGFQEPVLDVEQLELVYRDETKYRAEIECSGLLRPDAPFLPLPPLDEAGRIPLSIELIYAHAFCAETRGNEISVPVSAIERRYAGG